MLYNDQTLTRIKEAASWIAGDIWRTAAAAITATAMLGALVVGMRAAPLPVVGVILPHSVTTDPDYRVAFEAALRDPGYVNGRTVALTTHYASRNTPDEFAGFARDLIRRNADVIMVASTPALFAACSETAASGRPIPIVVATIASKPECRDPADVRQRYDTGRVTGSTLQAVPLVAKILELLQATGPYKRIAVLTKPGRVKPDIGDQFISRLRSAAPGVAFTAYPMTTRADIDARFEEIARKPQAERPEALIVSADGFFREHASAIAALALREALPSIFSTRNQARAGGLLAYGQSYPEAYHRAAF